jgi:ABC-2 type transport system ATP-binding protein
MQEPPLTEVAVFGNTLHVVTRREEDLSTYIPALLAARGIATKRLEQIEPSLEDVFVSLIEIGSRDNL